MQLQRGGAATRLVFLLFCLLLAGRGLVPAGFMPVPDKDGRLTIQICNGGATYKALFDPVTGGIEALDGEAMPEPEGTASGSHCPFALSAIFSLPVTAQLTLPVRFASIPVFPSTAPALPDMASTAIYVRGPPLHS